MPENSPWFATGEEAPPLPDKLTYDYLNKRHEAACLVDHCLRQMAKQARFESNREEYEDDEDMRNKLYALGFLYSAFSNRFSKDLFDLRPWTTELVVSACSFMASIKGLGETKFLKEKPEHADRNTLRQILLGLAFDLKDACEKGVALWATKNDPYGFETKLGEAQAEKLRENAMPRFYELFNEAVAAIESMDNPWLEEDEEPKPGDLVINVPAPGPRSSG